MAKYMEKLNMIYDLALVGKKKNQLEDEEGDEKGCQE